jgi:transposase
MSLKPTPVQPVPELTAQVAHAAFPKGNVYLQLRNEFGAIYDDALLWISIPTMDSPPRPLGA